MASESPGNALRLQAGLDEHASPAGSAGGNVDTSRATHRTNRHQTVRLGAHVLSSYISASMRIVRANCRGS